MLVRWRAGSTVTSDATRQRSMTGEDCAVLAEAAALLAAMAIDPSVLERMGASDAAVEQAEQAREVEASELGMVEDRDEHGRHAMEAGAALRLDGAEHREGIEPLARDDHAGPVRHAGEVAEDHAEAVIERHRNAEPIILRQAHGLAHEEPVVEDIVMGERRALGVAGRAAGELDIDRVVELKLRPDLRQPRRLPRTARLHQFVEGQHARLRARTEMNDRAQMGQALGFERAGRGLSDLGREFGEHA